MKNYHVDLTFSKNIRLNANYYFRNEQISKASFKVLMWSFCSSISEIEARLPQSQLLALCRSEAVLKWMSTCDHLMYQALVEILIPDVLRPIPSESQSQTPLVFPRVLCCFYCCKEQAVSDMLFCFAGALTQAIRNFAKSLEGWLNNAMNAIPQRMVQTKVHYCSIHKAFLPNFLF